MTGYFITFEGGEGGGKSTQSRLLKEALEKNGITVIHTREPGGTEGAEQIRELLVKGDASRWDAITETLMHMAARRDHTEKQIKPLLAEGKTVICDRFFDSTLAYQGYGHGLGAELVTMLHHLTIGTLKPDITFILDIDPEQGIARAHSRKDSDNRYESMKMAFHKRVREGFLAVSRSEPHRCHVIDATQGIEDIHRQIMARVLNTIPHSNLTITSV